MSESKVRLVFGRPMPGTGAIFLFQCVLVMQSNVVGTYFLKAAK